MFLFERTSAAGAWAVESMLNFNHRHKHHLHRIISVAQGIHGTIIDKPKKNREGLKRSKQEARRRRRRGRI